MEGHVNPGRRIVNKSELLCDGTYVALAHYHLSGSTATWCLRCTSHFFLLFFFVYIFLNNVISHILQSLELWNMTENKTMTLSAHDGLITGLAASTVTGLVSSASHDKIVKLWK